jgi:hypothetical protein
MRAIVAQLHFLNRMTAAREIFGKGYFSPDVRQKAVVDQQALSAAVDDAVWAAVNQAELAASIRQLYKELLGREADASGLQYWSDVAARSGSLDPVRGASWEVRNIVRKKVEPSAPVVIRALI